MPRLLYWNVHGKVPARMVADLCHDHDIDLCLLSEARSLVDPILKELNRNDDTYFYREPIACKKVDIFSRFDSPIISTVSDNKRFSIQSIREPGQSELLVVGVHLSSKMWTSSYTQADQVRFISDEIRCIESERMHRRTVIIGDFNADPFELGLIEPRGFHAVSCRRVAARMHRTVNSYESPLMYNPMWSHFGDRNGKPPGTYFRNGSDVDTRFWHVFDQVLISPELLESYSDDGVTVLDKVRDTSLLLKGIPNSDKYSDHLPLVCNIVTPQELPDDGHVEH